MKSKKAFYNIVSQFILELVALISSLILPRLILSTFGSAYNGLIASITQFLDFISLLTLGIAGSTRVAIYKASAEDDDVKVSRILKANEKYMHKVSIVLILYVFILAIIFPVLNKELPWITVAMLVFILSIGIFSNYFFGVTYITFLSSKQSMYIYYIIQIVFKLINIILTVILVYFTKSILIVEFGITLCFAICPLLLNVIVKKKFKINTKVDPDFSALENRKDVIGSSVANSVHSYTDIFMLTFFSNPLVVSIYSVYHLIMGAIVKLSNIFTTGLEGAFGDLWARNNKSSFNKNFLIFEFLMFCFISVIFTCTGLLILPFIKLYTSGVTDINYYLPVYALVLVMANALYVLRDPYRIIIQAAGKYKETKNYAIIEAIINLLLSFIGVKFFGLVGIMMATLIANLYGLIMYIGFSYKNLLGVNFKPIIKKILWLILNVLLSIGINFLLLKNLNFNTWFEWIINSILVSLITFIIVLTSSIIFYKKELIESILVFKNMIKIRRVKKDE